MIAPLYHSASLPQGPEIRDQWLNFTLRLPLFVRAQQAAVALLVVGMLLAQSHTPPAAAEPVREVDAQPEELQALAPDERAGSLQAVGGGLACTDAVSDVNIASGQRMTRTLSCPAGTVAVSGGATASVNTGLYINATGPTSGTAVDPNTWFTSMENYASPVGGIGPSVRFYARCCRVVP